MRREYKAAYAGHGCGDRYGAGCRRGLAPCAGSRYGRGRIWTRSGRLWCTGTGCGTDGGADQRTCAGGTDSVRDGIWGRSTGTAAEEDSDHDEAVFCVSAERKGDRAAERRNGRAGRHERQRRKPGRAVFPGSGGQWDQCGDSAGNSGDWKCGLWDCGKRTAGGGTLCGFHRGRIRCDIDGCTDAGDERLWGDESDSGDEP